MGVPGPAADLTPEGVGPGRGPSDRPRVDVSVVVPVLNEEAWLPRLLGSLAAQTLAVAEVTVVDAGSTDGTARVAREWGAAFLEGGGLPGYSRNLGAERARGEWLLFLDADVRLPATAVAETLSQAERRGLDAISTAFVPDGEGRLVALQHRLSSEYFWLSSRLGWPHSIGAYLFVRRSLHRAIGGFDTSITVAEDQDYVVRLRRAGRYAFTRRPVVEIAQRRFDARGLWRMSAKWLGIEAYRLLRGEIRDDRFGYFS